MEFLKILLPLLFLHNVPRAATTMCTTIERAHEKCCEDRKPLSCLFTRSKDPVCDCHPRDQEDKKLSTECAWNTFHQGPYLDCNMCGNMKSEASCPGKRYPIREIDRPDDAPHCAMSALNHQNFYDNVVLTCWLYDCEPRLRIPKATIQMNVMDKTKNLLCYPQILHSGSKLEFCQLYTTIRNVTVDKRDGTDSDTPEKRDNHTECVLPPICDANGKIDSKEYMYPLIKKKGKWKFHPSYCENLCPEDENDGKNNTCRIIPSCDPHYDYNYFKVPKCLPWCSDEDSYTRDPAKRSRICNVRPICNQYGKADEPYSATNPYGARENECLKMGECRGDWTEDTHFCTGGPSAKKEDGLLAHAGTILLVLIIVVSLIVVVLLTVCVGGGIAAYCFLWKNKKSEETEGEGEEEKCEGKKTAEAVGPKALPNSKIPKPGGGGSKEKKGGKATADVSTYFVVANNNVKKGQGSKVPETLTLDRPRPTVEMALRKTPSTKDFVVMFPAAWNEEQIAQDIERMKEEERQEENYRKTQDYWRKQREKEENEQPKGKQTPPPKKGFLAKIFEPSPADQAKKEEEKKKKEEEKEKEEIRKIYDHSMLKD